MKIESNASHHLHTNCTPFKLFTLLILIYITLSYFLSPFGCTKTCVFVQLKLISNLFILNYLQMFWLSAMVRFLYHATLHIIKFIENAIVLLNFMLKRDKGIWTTEGILPSFLFSHSTSLKHHKLHIHSHFHVSTPLLINSSSYLFLQEPSNQLPKWILAHLTVVMHPIKVN